MEPRTLIIGGGIAAAAVAAITIALLPAFTGGEPEPESTGAAPSVTARPADPNAQPTPGPSAGGGSDLAPGDPGYTPVQAPQKGVAAGGAGFPGLDLPEGVSWRIGETVPDDQLTSSDETLTPGSLVIARPYQWEADSDPVVLIQVESISDPLEGEERDKAAAALGELWPEMVAQRIELRVRHVAGLGGVGAWNLFESVSVNNTILEPMTTALAPGDGCATSNTPLAEADGTAGETVKVCLYAYGTVINPSQRAMHVTISSRHLADPLYIQADNLYDVDPGHSEEDHLHEEGEADASH